MSEDMKIFTGAALLDVVSGHRNDHKAVRQPVTRANAARCRRGFGG
jgi:hypothetical protein